MKDHRFMAKIYGVRGSYPISPPGGTKYGGNTTCLFTRTREHIVIFDVLRINGRLPTFSTVEFATTLFGTVTRCPASVRILVLLKPTSSTGP